MESAQDRDLATFFVDLSLSEKLSEIKPPLGGFYTKHWIDFSAPNCCYYSTAPRSLPFLLFKLGRGELFHCILYSIVYSTRREFIGDTAQMALSHNKTGRTSNWAQVTEGLLGTSKLYYYSRYTYNRPLPSSHAHFLHLPPPRITVPYVHSGQEG